MASARSLKEHVKKPDELTKIKATREAARWIFDKTRTVIRALQVEKTHEEIEKLVTDSYTADSGLSASIETFFIHSSKNVKLDTKCWKKFKDYNLERNSTAVVFVTTKYDDYYARMRRTLLLSNDTQLNERFDKFADVFVKFSSLVVHGARYGNVAKEMDAVLASFLGKTVVHFHDIYATPTGKESKYPEDTMYKSKAASSNLVFEAGSTYTLTLGLTYKKHPKYSFFYGETVIVNENRGVSPILDWDPANPDNRTSLTSASIKEEAKILQDVLPIAAPAEPLALSENTLGVRIGGMVKRK